MALADMSWMSAGARPSRPDAPLERWAEFLASHKLRETAPRRQIIQAILMHPGHFDAETLRLRLRGQGRHLSRATIYRTLALLQGGGILRRVQLIEGTLHYELARPNDPHHHLICRRCGSVQEVTDATLTRAVTDAVQRSHFAAEEVSLRVRGLCSKCRGSSTPP
jgi:Fur family transcriptional regulator, ferric uptake regulator